MFMPSLVTEGCNYKEVLRRKMHVPMIEHSLCSLFSSHLRAYGCIGKTQFAVRINAIHLNIQI